MEYITKYKLPSIGFGIHHLDEGALAVDTTYRAIESGWRVLETAGSFLNECSLGLGIQMALEQHFVKRDELVVSTKLRDDMQGYEFANQAFQCSLNNLGLDYIDIFAIRLPLIMEEDWQTPLIDTWRAMEQLYEKGKIKILAVSNFAVKHLEFLINRATYKPMINQLEIHPYFQQLGLQKFCQENEIYISSWASLDYGKICYDKSILGLSQKYNKTPAQIVLRWHTQKGHFTITRTTNYDRMKKNLDIFSFTLNERDMNAIDNLNDLSFKSKNWPTEQIRKHGGAYE